MNDSFSPILTAGLVLMSIPFAIGFVLFVIDVIHQLA